MMFVRKLFSPPIRKNSATKPRMSPRNSPIIISAARKKAQRKIMAK
jgi:hypothetical protein